jgi:iron(III) transport system substrate-binding protein
VVGIPNLETNMRTSTESKAGDRLTLGLGTRALVALGLLLCPAGCGGPAPDQQAGPAGTKPPEQAVVVYSALDREFAEPVLNDQAKQAGVSLRAKFDVESTKTVGLVNTLINESVQPRCDLFWNNEILNTMRLKDRGLLQPFRPAHADDIDAAFKDPDGTWYGFAARARILLVNTQLVPESARPAGLADLIDPRHKGKIGIAKPLFGTTATQAACLFAAWGEEKASRFFLDLKANGVQVFSGNRQVATAVGSGQIEFGLTDTDDAMGEIEAGSPVAIVYPDRAPGALGTLFIPNTLTMMKGAPHAEAARKLADLIYSPEVEARLAEGPSVQIPLLRSTSKPARVETPATIHSMAVDFREAAKQWDRAAVFLAREFAD